MSCVIASEAKQSFCILVLIAFLSNTFGPFPQAQADDLRLPAPGVRVGLSPEFNPPILKGIKVHPDNPFRFDFILDQGDSLPKRMSSPNVLIGDPQQEQLKTEATKLIKYFLASLTIPEKDLWVNLSPYEKDRIIPQSFGLTEMGRDLLAEDYMLKQITASLIYPEDEVGKKFWKRIYEEAAKKFGTTNIPVNTFNKVWIVPEKAVVYENAKAGTAYVVESKLKVMLEQDYLALSKHAPADLSKTNQSAGASQVLREILIPALEKEVNEGKNFTQLRQVYNSLILATWYKKKIKDSILAQVYEDKKKIAGVQYTSTVIPAPAALLRKAKLQGGIQNKDDVEAIYHRYLQAFKKGVYNYIKEEPDPMTQETIPRKYFSGGVGLRWGIDGAMTVTEAISALRTTISSVFYPNSLVEVEGNFQPSGVSLPVPRINVPPGYRLIGGENDRQLAARLLRTTGQPAALLGHEVYSPSQDNELTLEFMDIISSNIEKLDPRTIKNNELKVLEIGSGSGLGAMTAFHQAKQRGFQVKIDAVDINDESVENTQKNFELLKNEVKAEDRVRIFKVPEDGQLAALSDQYDLILFYAPDAVPKKELGGAGVAIRMDQDIFKRILQAIADRLLAKKGVAIIGVQKNIMNTLAPESLEWEPSGTSEAGVYLRGQKESRGFFKVSIRNSAQLAKVGIDLTANKAQLTPEDLYKEIIKHPGEVINNKNIRYKENAEYDVTVYKSLGVVVKVPKNESPELNKSVALVKASLNGIALDFIIADVDGKHIIIQKMADQVLSDLLEDYTPDKYGLLKQYFQLQNDMIQRGVFDADPKPPNFGVINGKLYLLDVGNKFELKDLENIQKSQVIAFASLQLRLATFYFGAISKDFNALAMENGFDTTESITKKVDDVNIHALTPEPMNENSFMEWLAGRLNSDGAMMGKGDTAMKVEEEFIKAGQSGKGWIERKAWSDGRIFVGDKKFSIINQYKNLKFKGTNIIVRLYRVSSDWEEGLDVSVFDVENQEILRLGIFYPKINEYVPDEIKETVDKDDGRISLIKRLAYKSRRLLIGPEYKRKEVTLRPYNEDWKNGCVVSLKEKPIGIYFAETNMYLRLELTRRTDDGGRFDYTMPPPNKDKKVIGRYNLGKNFRERDITLEPFKGLNWKSGIQILEGSKPIAFYDFKTGEHEGIISVKAIKANGGNGNNTRLAPDQAMNNTVSKDADIENTFNRMISQHSDWLEPLGDNPQLTVKSETNGTTLIDGFFSLGKGEMRRDIFKYALTVDDSTGEVRGPRLNFYEEGYVSRNDLRLMGIFLMFIHQLWGNSKIKFLRLSDRLDKATAKSLLEKILKKWSGSQEVILNRSSASYTIDLTRLDYSKIEEYLGTKIGGSPQLVKGDAAMVGQDKGGIDLTPANMNLQTKIGSPTEAFGNDKGIQFHLDPAMLAQLQNAPGFVPVIISFKPLHDLKLFLGVDVLD